MFVTVPDHALSSSTTSHRTAKGMSQQALQKDLGKLGP